MTAYPEPSSQRAYEAYKLFEDAQALEDLEAREYRTDEFVHRLKNPLVKEILTKYGKDYGTNFLDRVCSLVENSQEISGYTVKAPDGETWSKEKLARGRRKVQEIVERTQFTDIIFPAMVQDEATYGSAYLRVWGHPEDRTKAVINEVGAEHGRIKYRDGSITIPEFYVERFKLRPEQVGETKGDFTGIEIEFPDGRLEKYWAANEDRLKPEGWKPLYDTFVLDPETGAILEVDGHPIPVWPILNGRGRLLTTHCRNKKGKRGYGQPAHYNAYKAQNELTTTTNSRQQALDYGGVGSIVVLNDADVQEKLPGYGTGAASSPFYNPFGEDDQDALFDVEDEWVSGPGVVNRLNKAKQIVQLKAESIANYLSGEERSLNYLCSVTETAFSDMLPEKGQALGAEARRQGRFGFIRKIRKLTTLNTRYVARAIADAVEYEDPDLAGIVIEPQFVPADDFDAIEVVELAQAYRDLYVDLKGLPEVAQVDLLKRLGKSDEWIEEFLQEIADMALEDDVVTNPEGGSFDDRSAEDRQRALDRLTRRRDTARTAAAEQAAKEAAKGAR